MRTEKEEGAGNQARNPRQARNDREAIFRTVRGAMMFALNFKHGTLKQPSLVAMMGGARTGRGLGGLDGAAQAGMILAELGRVRHRRQAMLTARCAPPSLPCTCRSSCCREWRLNPEWDQAITLLTAHVLEEGLAGTVSHYRLRRAMVVRYFLGKEGKAPRNGVPSALKQSLADVAQACGVHRNTASSYNKAIVEHLRKEEQLATFEIEGLLKDAFIIE